jgi:hypothetical protein
MAETPSAVATSSVGLSAALSDASTRRMIVLTVRDLRRRNAWAGLAFGVLSGIGTAVVTGVMFPVAAVPFAAVGGLVLGTVGVVTLLNPLTRIELRSKAAALGLPPRALLDAWDQLGSIDGA